MDTRPSHRLSFDEALTQFSSWLRKYHVTPKTVKNYVSDVRRFFLWHSQAIGDLSLEEISPNSLEQYLSSLTANAVPSSTIARKLASLRKLEQFTREYLTQPTHWVLPTNPGTTTKAELARDKVLQRFQLALSTAGCKPATVENYVLDIRFFLAFFPSGTLAEICTKPKVAEYLAAERQNGLASSTLQRRLVSLRRFLSWAAREEYLPENPLESRLARAARTVTDFVPLAFFQPRVKPRPITTLLQPEVPLSHKPGILGLYDWYSHTRLSSYLHLSILVIFAVMLSLFGYRQFFGEVAQNYAYPSSPVRPHRTLSFQGRLTDSGGTPITTPINFTFRLYNAKTGGIILWDSSANGVCSIDPDQDGVFSTLLGNPTEGCGSEISEDVFSEHNEVWLEVQVSNEILDPRQRIATVPYALNSETVQGFPVSLEGGINTIPVINALGEIIIGANNPKLIASSGAFLIRAESFTFETEDGTDGDINFAPDGNGSVNILSSTTNQNSLLISNGSLTTGSLIRGEVGNNSGTFKLLSLASGSTLDDKFVVDAAGNTTIDGQLRLPGQGSGAGIVIGGDTNLYRNSADSLKTDDAFVVGTTLGVGTSATIGTSLTVGTALTVGDLDTPGGVIYSTNSDGLLGVSAAGTSGQCLQSGGSGTPTWGSCGSGSGDAFWTSTNGALYPLNSTLDLFVGGTATSSAKFAFTNVTTGTPTFRLNQASNIQTTAGDLSLISADDIIFNDVRTGDIPFTVADSSINANLGQGVIDAINDLYGLSTAGTDAFWVQSNGALQTANNTVDVLFGGTATTSAKFAFININTGTPTLRFNQASNITTSTGDLTLGTGGTGDLILTAAGEILLNDGVVDASNQTVDITLNDAADAWNFDSNTLSIDALNERVGFGTAAPQEVVHIGAGADAAGLATSDLLVTRAGASSLSVRDSTNDVETFVAADSTGGTIGTLTANSLFLQTNNSTVMTLLSGGNVGVGDTTPASLFTVGSGDLFQVNSSGNIAAIGGAAHSISNSSSDLLVTAVDDLRLIGTNNIVFNDVRTGDIPFTLVDTAINASLGQAVIDAINDLYDLSTGGSAVDAFWVQNNGVLQTANNTVDVLFGGTASTSAKFAFLYVSDGVPTASISGTTAGTNTYLTGDGLLSTTNKKNLVLGSATSGDIILNPRNGAEGRVGILTSNPNAVLHVTGGYSDHALAIFDQLFSGDIWTASASGVTRLRVTNGGDLVFNQASSITTSTGNLSLSPALDLRLTPGDDIVFNDVRTADIPFTLVDTALNANLSQAVIDAINDIYDLSQVDAFWVQENGALHTANPSVDVLIGGSATESAKFAFINVLTGTPTASISAGTAGATYLTAAGNLQTTANQPLTFGGNTTGLLVFNEALWDLSNQAVGVTLNDSIGALNFDSDTLCIDALNERVGIGDCTPASMLTVGSGDLFQVNSLGEIVQIDGVAHTINSVSSNLTLTSNSQIVNIADNLFIGAAPGGLSSGNIVDDDNQSFISLIEEDPGTQFFPVKEIIVSGLLTVSDYISGGRGATLSAFVPSDKLLTLRGDDNGQTADYVNINTFGMNGGDIFRITANGLVGINMSTASPAGQLHVISNTSVTPTAVFQTATSQTADLTQWRNSSGTVLSSVDADGNFRIGEAAVTQDKGLLNVNGGNGNSLVILDQDTIDQNILSASASGITRATIDRFGDYKMYGPKNQTTYANLVDVYVYDTTSDIDGGNWTNSDRSKSSSWYNETLDHTFETCVAGTDDRCGTQYFPKRTSITADSSGVRIYDADTQKVWMAFTQGTTALGTDADNNPSSVQMLNGRLYVGTNGSSATGLYIFDFMQDDITRYDTNGRWKYTLPLSGRNSSGSWVQLSNVTTLPNNIINSLSAETILGDNKTLPIDNTYITSGHYTPFNPADSDTARQDISDYAHDYVAVGTDGGAKGTVSLIQPDFGNMANIGISNSGIASKNVFLLDDGTLYYTYRDQNSNANDKLKVLKDAQKKMSTDPTYRITNTASDSATYIYGNKGGSNWGIAFHDALDSAFGFIKGPTFPTATPVINDIFVTKSSSTVDGRGNTIFLADDASGVTVIQEKSGDELNGSVKYLTSNYITGEIPGNIKGIWGLNNNTASDLEDLSFNANDLTNTNSVTFTATGVRQTAASFTRASRQFLASSSATLAHASALNVQGEMSLGAWVYVSDTTDTSGKQVILSKSGDITRLGYKLYLDGGVPVMSVSEDGSDFNTASASGRLATNTWHHLVANIIPYKEIQLFVDGQIATKSAGAAISPSQTLAPFRLGADAQSANIAATGTDLGSDGTYESNTVGIVQATTTIYAVDNAWAFQPGDYVNLRNFTQSTGTQTVITYVDTVAGLIQVLASPASTTAGDSVTIAKINHQRPSSGYFTTTTQVDGVDGTAFAIGDLVQWYNVTDGTTGTGALSATTESTVTFSAVPTGATATDRVYITRLNSTTIMNGEISDAVDTLTLPNAGGYFKIGESLHVFERITTTVTTWTSISSTTATTIDVVGDVINNATTDDYMVSKVNKYAPVQGTAASATVIDGPNNTQFAIGDYVQLTRTNGTIAQARDTVTAVSSSSITVTTGVSAQAAADTIYVSKLNNESVGEEFYGGRIDEPFVTEANLTPEQVKKMYQRGAAALQNHTASRVTGVTGADSYQQLHGGGASAATVDRVTALAVDESAGVVYVGTNDNSANTGGVSVIGLSSDSLLDLYDDTNNTTKDDENGNQFDGNDVVAIDVHGSEIKNLAIAGSNDTNTLLWLEASNVSLRSFMNNNYNPHGETLNQTNLRVEDTLFLGKAAGQQNYLETSGNLTKFYGNLAINGDTIFNGQLLSEERQFTAKPLIAGGTDIPTIRGMTLGSDGFARIVWDDTDLGTIKYIRCRDTNCNQYAFNLIDDGGEGNYTADEPKITLGPDGLPRLLYRDTTKGRLFFVRCLDDNCQARTKTVISGEGASITNHSLAVRSDGTAVIAAADVATTLVYFDCKNLDCSFVNSNVMDTATAVQYTSIGVNAHDLARISYHETAGLDLEYVACEDRACRNFTQATIDSTGTTGTYSQIDIGTDGFARVAAYDTGTTDIIFVQCLNDSCSNRTSNNVDVTASSVGTNLDMRLNSSNLAVISYYNASLLALQVSTCSTESCSSYAAVTVDDGVAANHGAFTSIDVNSSDEIRVLYYDSTLTALSYAVCSTTCSANQNGLDIYSAFALVESSNTSYVSHVIGFDNLSRISFYESTNSAWRYLRCLDVDCNAFNLRLLDSTDLPGQENSMALGPDGFVYMVSYESTGDHIQFIKCNDDDCNDYFLKTLATTVGNSAGTQISILRAPVIRIGRDGLPRVAYHTNTLGVGYIRCLDVFCHSFHNTNINLADSSTNGTTSMDMILDPNDFATMVYARNSDPATTNTITLRYFHCTDIDCNSTDGLATVTSAVGTDDAGVHFFINQHLDINPHTGLPLITVNHTNGSSVLYNCSNWESCATLDSGGTTIGSAGAQYGSKVDKNTGQLLIGTSTTNNITIVRCSDYLCSAQTGSSGYQISRSTLSTIYNGDMELRYFGTRTEAVFAVTINPNALYYMIASGVNYNVGSPDRPFSNVYANKLQARNTTIDALDLAEEYPTSETMAAGEVASFDPNRGEHIMKSRVEGDPKLAGVVSTAPGLLLKDSTVKGNLVPLAMAGRVPVRIDPDSEPIKVGDFITSSGNIPGRGKKATKPGYVIGKSLGDWQCSESFVPDPLPPGTDPDASPSGQIKTVCPESVTVFVGLEYYDPYLGLKTDGEFMISEELVQQASGSGEFVATQESELAYVLRDGSGNIVDRLGAFGQIVAGTIRSGLIRTQTLIAGTITAEDSLLTPALRTDFISTTASGSGDLIVDLRRAGTASGSAEDSFGTLLVQGNASISGTLYAENMSAYSARLIQLETQQADLLVLRADDASISGTLRAGRLEGAISSEQIEGLEDRVTNLISRQRAENVSASESGLLAGNQDVQRILNLLNGSPIATASDPWGTVASEPTVNGITLADLAQINQDIQINGLLAATNLVVEDTFALGTTLFRQHELAWDPGEAFAIQPSGQGTLSLLASTMVLSTDGVSINTSVHIAGDLDVGGSLFADLIKPNQNQNVEVQLASSNIPGEFVVRGQDNQEVAAFSASGSARLRKLVIAAENASAEGGTTTSVLTNATAGTAALPANSLTFVVRNTQVRDSSLLYITPTSSTENHVLFIQSKTGENPETPENEGQFVVAIDAAASQDIHFNWWIIN